jgi:predicted RNA methylase
VLGLFRDLVLAADLRTTVVDVGCGTGRLEPATLNVRQSHVFAQQQGS